MKNKILIIRIIITLFLSFLLFYIFLPPLNPTSIEFWVFLLFIVGVFFITSALNLINITQVFRNISSSALKTGIIPMLIAGVFVLIMLLNFFLSPVFRANSYSKRISINEDGKFTEEVKEVDFNTLPLLDKSSSQKLGDRVMGQMPELVSQFYVSNLYTQINYNDKIIRVTPLEYNGIFDD